MNLNKKGQIDYPIITLIVIIVSLLILAPVVLKIFNSIKTPMSDQLANVSGGDIASQNFNTVMNTATNFWDKVIFAAFILAVILMLISAFLIDTHPFWIILYIFISFMVVLFAPDIVGSLSNIYDSANFATEIAQLTYVNTLRTYFGEFLIGVFVITGIIMFGKIWLFPSKGGK